MNSMAAHDTQSFFTPDEFSCLQEPLLASTYNLAHILLNRSESEHVFVPIRSMQYLAVIEADAFWFVDSLAYAVRGNEGGRMITVSWHPAQQSSDREGLDQHLDCRIMFYDQDMSDIQTRLRGEFLQSMQQLDQRYRDQNIPAGGAKILSLK